ncbi:MAG: tetratricopeptide repeat protein [Pseudomonadota bacterium]
MPAAAQTDPPRIEFGDVLADPTNLALNVAFARQQIEDGDLPGASATLERLLIQAPSQNEVRLLYAVVLLRLGQPEEAQREFAAVDENALSAADRGAYDRGIEDTARALQSVTGDAGVTLGLHYDTNRDSFPIGGSFQVELPGTGPIIIDTDEDGTEDVAFFSVLDGGIDWTPTSQRLRQVSVDATLVGVNQARLDDFDILSGFVGTSAIIDATVFDIVPSASFRVIGLGGSRYLTTGEGGLRLERPIGTDRRTIAFVGGSGGFNEFGDVDADPFGSEQTGPFLTAEAGIAHQPFDRLQLAARYRYSRRFAEFDFESFDAHAVFGSLQYVLTPGAVLQFVAGYERTVFDEPDPFVSLTEEERDNAVQTRLGVVISAEAALRVAGIETNSAFARNLTLNVGGSYRRVFSNIENFEFQNFRFETAITKRFFF